MTQALPIEVMPESLEAFHQLAALRRRCAPDQPHLAGEDLFWGWRTRERREGLKGLWWVRAEGRAIATLTVLPEWWNSTPASLVIGIDVDPQWRRRGIGGRLLAHVDQLNQQATALPLTTMVRSIEPDGLRFAENNGCQEVTRFYESRLGCETPLAPRWRERVAEVKAAGFEIMDGPAYQARFPDDWLERWWRVMRDAELDMPPDEPREPRSLESFERLLTRPALDMELVTFCVLGSELAGFSSVARYGLSPNCADIWTTGVSRDHRRKGVATAVKVTSIIDLAARGVQWLYTQNEQTNPTYGINVALGFERCTSRLLMKRPVPA